MSAEEVERAVAVILRVAAATASHLAEIDSIRTALKKVERRERLTKAQRDQVRVALGAWHEAHPTAALMKVRTYSPEIALKFALKNLLERRDQPAERLLLAISRAGAKYRDSGQVASDERDSRAMLRSVEKIYREVRDASRPIQGFCQFSGPLRNRRQRQQMQFRTVKFGLPVPFFRLDAAALSANPSGTLRLLTRSRGSSSRRRSFRR